MKIKKVLPIERLIAKIDNDFNISESDWIPRVAAWVIDALSQMKVLPMEKKRRTLEVNNRVAIFPCVLNGFDLKVYDSGGREISPVKENGCSKPCNATNKSDSNVAIFVDDHKGVDFMKVASVTNISNRTFVFNGNNQIYLNFDTDEIQVESYEVVTYYSDYFDTDIPYIYDNGLLLEALAWYCLFKYLSRGSTHPVYDLKSTSPVTNPYIQWNTLRPKAAASVKQDIASDNNGWNNFFYNSTFLPRSN